MVLIAIILLVIDQITKLIVLRYLDYAQQIVIWDGFFKLVHWGNTGAAWSMFSGNNRLLAGIAVVALVILYMSRRHLDVHTAMGQIALGLMFGGILGNLVDRIRIGHVVDFVRFYVNQRGGGEIGFPAFNVADMAICTGVGLILLLSWRNEPKPAATDPV
jgi:signal peptidase II